MRSFRFLAVGLLCACIALSGCAPAAQEKPSSAPAATSQSGADAKPATPAAPVKIKIGQASNSLAFAAVYVANGAGYFKEAGLEVEQVVMQGSAPAAAALLNDEVTAMVGDLDKVFDLAQKDSNKVILVQFPTNAVTLDLVFSNAFMQKKGLTPQSSLEDRLKAMKGSKMGTLSVGGTPHKLMSFLVRKVGLNPEKDFEVVATGNPPGTLAALKNGSIDGFMLSAPTSIQVEEENLGKVVVRFDEVPELRGSPSLGIAVRSDYANKNPAVIKGMVQAIAKAHSLLSEKPNEGAKLLQASYPGVKPELLEASVRALRPAFGNKGMVTDQALKNASSLFKEAGFMPTELSLREGVHWTNQFNP